MAIRGKIDNDEGDPPEDFGFYYPFEYVRRAFLYLERGWGWPEGGGWNEQDARLLDDLDTYHAQYAAIDQTVESQEGQRVDPSAGDDELYRLNSDQF